MKNICHLSQFYEQAIRDTGLSTTHVSLFMALFQRWKQTHFKTSIQISRDDIMKLAKVRSKATYHRCMQYLHKHNYIDYQPSYNPLKGSTIRFFPSGSRPSTKPVQQTTRPPKEPFYNLSNPFKEIEIDRKIPASDLTRSQTGQVEHEYAAGIPPAKEVVHKFFLAQGSSEKEAKRFINHYTANGWLVGGRSKMMDWKASARNWITNSINFNGHGKHHHTTRAQQLNTRTDKSYQEPL